MSRADLSAARVLREQVTRVLAATVVELEQADRSLAAVLDILRSRRRAPENRQVTALTRRSA